MNEDYISFEVAKLAKEAGFNWMVGSAYYKNERIDQYYGYQNQGEEYYSRCSQAVLLKWIRERFDLLVRMYFDEDTLKFESCHSLINFKTGFQSGMLEERKEFNSFEEAVEESLKNTLRFILKQNIHLK